MSTNRPSQEPPGWPSRQQPQRDSAHWKPKIGRVEAEAIRAAYMREPTTRQVVQLATLYHVTTSTVRKILRRKLWA